MLKDEKVDSIVCDSSMSKIFDELYAKRIGMSI
jgi:hypothetical protein